jgi:hypothetical protein
MIFVTSNYLKFFHDNADYENKVYLACLPFAFPQIFHPTG